jgi:hypothetical protein
LNIYRTRFAYACRASAHTAIRITSVTAITIMTVSAISKAAISRTIKSVIVYAVSISEAIKWSIDIEDGRIKSRVAPAVPRVIRRPPFVIPSPVRPSE